MKTSGDKVKFLEWSCIFTALFPCLFIAWYIMPFTATSYTGVHLEFVIIGIIIIRLCVYRLKLEAITHLKNQCKCNIFLFSDLERLFGQRPVACSGFLNVNLDEWIQYNSQK